MTTEQRLDLYRRVARRLYAKLADRKAFYLDRRVVRDRLLEELCTKHGLRHEWANIVANGVASIYDHPTYAQHINGLRHEVDRWKASARRLGERLAAAEADRVDVWRQGHLAGARQERAAIVEFLRSVARDLDDVADPDADFVRDVARRVEEGEAGPTTAEAARLSVGAPR